MKFYYRIYIKTYLLGYYEESSLPVGSLNSVTEEQLVTEMTQDILNGCDGTNIRCGVIGEVASVWPITGRHIAIAINHRALMKNINGQVYESFKRATISLHWGRGWSGRLFDKNNLSLILAEKRWTQPVS